MTINQLINATECVECVQEVVRGRPSVYLSWFVWTDQLKTVAFSMSLFGFLLTSSASADSKAKECYSSVWNAVKWYVSLMKWRTYCSWWLVLDQPGLDSKRWNLYSNFFVNLMREQTSMCWYSYLINWTFSTYLCSFLCCDYSLFIIYVVASKKDTYTYASSLNI